MRTKLQATPTRYWLSVQCERWLARDRRLAQWLHRAAAFAWFASALAVASRLGNGVVWYTLIAAVPFLAGQNGMLCSVQMLVVGTFNLILYGRLKRWTSRDRPYVRCAGIKACARPLDRYSFPSGHTLHAVAFAMVVTTHYPAYAPLTWGFVVLVALSRVVLGLHYPTDVAAGALIGFATGWLALGISY